MRQYHKLVRDRIPEIIEADGKSCICETLSDEDYISLLDRKLNEELAEYQESKSLEELADLLEVMQAVVKARGWTLEELEQVRTDKAAKRGGFEKKILLKGVLTDKMLLFYKTVDYSVLTAGLTIPVQHQKSLFHELGFALEYGQRKQIQILIDGAPYLAQIINIRFDKSKYPNHKDLLQIRYSAKSPIAQKLQEIFAHSKSQVALQRQDGKKHRTIDADESQKEHIAIYSTPISGRLCFDCMPIQEFQEESNALKVLGEPIAEGILDGRDETAGILIKTTNCKIRKLSRAIADDLKAAYGYRCQICGQYIGEPYGSRLIHAHHIHYFVDSLNNNANNIMIVCPNHHAIIHDLNPTFDFVQKQFHYPNGYVEGLAINLHL